MPTKIRQPPAGESYWKRPVCRRLKFTRSVWPRPVPEGSATECILFSCVPANASPDRRPEKGIEVRLITPAELAQLVKTGEFPSLLHIATLFLAERHSFIDLRSD